MCGIVGFVGRRNHELLEKMASAISDRGPDGRGFYYNDSHGLNIAHTRLSVLDLDGGHQPMWNDDSTVGIVFNGEIYNHKELRDQLKKKGYRFKSTNSDTEVLIHGYIEWGDELPAFLNGMFAFCIVDLKKKRLFLSRDRFGEKPLYYYANNGDFVFCSELDSLTIHPAVRQETCPIAISKYFAYGFIPAPYSLYKRIYKLPAGHTLAFDLSSQSFELKRFWRFDLHPDSMNNNAQEEEHAEELRHLLISAVQRRMVADVPIGIFLSGGVDSSSVLACASQLKRIEKIKTFSIGFHEKIFDESDIARDVANVFSTDHYEEILGIDDAKLISYEVLDKLDEPLADSSLLPTYLLSKFARKEVKVCLGGDGSDELFAGYAPFHALKFAEIYSKMTSPKIRKWITSAVKKIPASDNYLSIDFKIKKTLDGLNNRQSCWNPAWLAPLKIEDISRLMNLNLHSDDVYGDAIDAWEKSNAVNLVDKTSEFYVKFYLQNNILTKVDRASMMNSLEVRSPFLDNEVVDFVQRLPHRFKLRGSESKYILKKSMEPLLSKKILYRRKKGFAIPLAKWLKTWPIDSVIPGFDSVIVREFEKNHKQGVSDNRLFLWSWIVLQSRIKRHAL